MATQYKLVISDDISSKQLEVQVVNSETIFLQEIDTDPCDAFWFNLSRDEWEEMKKYIDAKFSSNG